MHMLLIHDWLEYDKGGFIKILKIFEKIKCIKLCRKGMF